MPTFDIEPSSEKQLDREGRLLRSAQEGLASSDPYTREAGAQLLAGLCCPDALLLLERTCSDQEERVVEGGMRALLASVATGSAEAEAVLLRVLTRSPNGNRVGDCFGTLAVEGSAARRFQFLAANPDMARCRLQCLESGSFRSVQAYRSHRLRSNPSFAALFEVIRHDPDLPRTLKAMLSRRGEFLEQKGEPLSLEPFHSDIRRMTALLAGFAADPALTALCNLVIDRTVSRESNALWEQLKREVPYVPELVVGAGPHSANFCSALAVLRSDRLPLVLEKRERIGGQFAAPEGAAWFLNSRARPPSEDRQSLPGRGTALNSLGAYAPVQEGDMTGQSYASQDRIALATRLTLLLSCHALVGAVFVKRYRNNTATRKRLGLPQTTEFTGKYLIQIERVGKEQHAFLTTDCLVFAGGLGEPGIAFRDRSSLRAVSNDKRRTRQGFTSRYLSFEEFMARRTNPSDPFPLRGRKRVIVIGDGDSATVTIEALLGYGPSVGQSVHTLDRVDEVVWIGQEATDRTEYLYCQRPRYHLLGVEFPREESPPSSAARIRPVPERAVGFQVEGEQGVVTTNAGNRYAADLVIDCTGFQTKASRAPKSLSGYTANLREESRLRVCDSLGTKIALRLEFQAVVTIRAARTTRYRLFGAAFPIGKSTGYRAFTFTIPDCEASQIGAELERTIQINLNLPETTRLYLQRTVLPVVYATINGEKRPIARQERGEQVYYLGPQSGLPFPSDIAESLGVGEENAVALWRYSAEVTAFAEHYFANLLKPDNSNKAFLPTFEVRELTQTRKRKEIGDLVLGPLRREEALKMANCVDSRHLLKYLLCEHLRSFCLPMERIDRTLTLQLTPIPKGEGRVGGLEVRSDAPSINGCGLLPLLEALATDPLLQEVSFRIGLPTRAEERSERGRPITIRIAVRKGRFHLERVETGF